MGADLHGKSLICLLDFEQDAFDQIFSRATELKEKLYRGESTPLLAGKTMAMIFEKPSTRTRVSFEVAMYQLGGAALNMNARDLQLGRGETIADTARVLSRYVNGIMARTFEHQKVVDLAEHGTVPVINGLTNFNHPCQILADLQTIREELGTLKGLRLVYLGDCNNVANSLIFATAKLGLDLTLACPEGFGPAPEVLAMAEKPLQASQGQVSITSDPREAAQGADVLYTDVWVSMGQEEGEARKQALRPYQINSNLLRLAKDKAIVLHCLPAHRGEEITDEVLDGPHSRVLPQAENRLHVQKAVMSLLMG